MSFLAGPSLWTPPPSGSDLDGPAVDDLNVEKRGQSSGYKAFYRHSIGWHRATHSQTSLGLEGKGCVRTLECSLLH